VSFEGKGFSGEGEIRNPLPLSALLDTFPAREKYPCGANPEEFPIRKITPAQQKEQKEKERRVRLNKTHP